MAIEPVTAEADAEAEAELPEAVSELPEAPALADTGAELWVAADGEPAVPVHAVVAIPTVATSARMSRWRGISRPPRGRRSGQATGLPNSPATSRLTQLTGSGAKSRS